MSGECVPKATTSLELHGAAASSSPHSILYLPGQSILYASNCILNIATPVNVTLDDKPVDDDSSVVYTVRSTLRTRTVPRTDWIRSITALALLRPATASGDKATDTDTNQDPCMVVCAFSDGTITLWIQKEEDDGSCSWMEHVVTGLTSAGEVVAISQDEEETPSLQRDDTSIADIDGVYYRTRTGTSNGNGSVNVIIMIASANGVQSYQHCIDMDMDDTNTTNQKKTTTAMIATYPTSTIKFTTMDNQHLLSVGTALPRNNRIHFYTQPITSCEAESSSSLIWKHQGSVMGHLDWISCLDWSWSSTSTGMGGAGAGTGMLASGSQDARIRLWKFHPCTPSDEDEEETMDDGADDEEEDDEDLIEEGEARMFIRYDNADGNGVQSAVTLEALLIGHEEHVTSVAWRPGPKSKAQAPCLISSSMDRSILIWMEEEDEQTNASASAVTMSEGSGNVWVPVTRVGTAGGVLGGSIGSSLLGFINVLWSDDGKRIVGHGFGGAIYFWSSSYPSSDHVASTSTSVERWLATPGITGHFRGCSDISWEASKGMYLLSGGLDQTCRLWMQVPTLERRTEGEHEQQFSTIWKEVGRPQVHGYDLNTLTCIGSGKGELIHRFVSGADEKEARAFDAPKETMKLIQRLRGNDGEEIVPDSDSNEERVERAFIPSLGLSNRANVTDAMEEGMEVGVSKDQSSENKDDHNEGEEESIAKALPRERDLGVASLWPEIRKLYGHLTEMVCLASTAGKCDDHILVASSCKARDVENAAIRVWNVERNVCLDILKNGHKSTVVSLSFSSDGKLLASAGKDRRLCIWKKNQTGDEISFNLSAIVESAHKRIIWSADFCIVESSILATGSRDGNIKIWRIVDEEAGDENNGIAIKELFRFEPLSKGVKKVEPVTATAFAPTSISIQCGNELVRHGILAIGMECGLIEIWAVPLGESLNVECTPRLLHSIPVQECHIGVVKKLAWRPLQKNESYLTLASCSTDHGVRIYRVSLSL